jgi:malonyl CoA-acyl carrier protein transacylase
MASALENPHNNASPARVLIGDAENAEGEGICFLFTGQGSQYVGMGRELYESSAVFRAAMERCDAAWKEETGESLIEVLYPGKDEIGQAESRMKRARYAQPSLFAFEYALAEMWRSWGIEPRVVLGHSLGEYVAAVIAGIFSAEDGMRLVCARARLMDKLTEVGAMRSIAATAERVQKAIAGLEKEVAIGVINGAETVVLSGLAATVERVAKQLEAEGIRTRALEVTHAFHSPLLEPILDEFEACAETVTYHAPQIRIISNLTGKTAQAEQIATARYWREHMRGTVQFDAGLKSALATGCQTLLEIGPQPHLKALSVRSDESLEPRVKISMRRQRTDWEQMLETLAQLYIEGQTIDWSGFDEGNRRTRMALPTYPFERQRYWLSGQNEDISQQRWQRVAGTALSQSKLAPIGLKVEAFGATWEALERLTIAEILHTLRGLGAFSKAGVSHDAQSLADSCGILPAHAKLMGRWMQLLCKAGYLERDGSRFLMPVVQPEANLDQAWRDAEQCLQDDPFLLEYLRNCSKHLRGVLLGTTSPLETLFPGGSPDLARNLYENSSAARYANLIVAAAVKAVVDATPTKRRLQILELGGGTGATTAAVLPGLIGDRVSYHFTDVSGVFLERAGARFASYPFVRYGLLDIENESHLAPRRGSFDVVIAANVVHATKNLQTTLSGIASLLAPGGVMMLLETTQSFAWHDITTGLIEGWQKSDDDLRAGVALLGVAEWTSALQAAGLDQIVSAPEPESAAGILGLHVILARASMTNAALVPQTQGTLTIADMQQEGAWAESSSFSSATPNPEAAIAITALLQEVPQSERRALLLDIVVKEIAQVMRLGTGTLPRKRDRLMDLGMDSLMAVELRNRLSKLLGVDSLPATLIFDYPTPDAVAGYLLARLQGEGPSESAGETSAPLPVVREKLLTAEEVGDLSEEDVAELLRSRLA